MSRPPMPNAENRCILVYGKESSADRTRLMKEFSEFGKVKKIFIENSSKYSKVYFESKKTCEEVVDAFKVNHLGWIVEYPKAAADVRNLELSLRNVHPQSESSIISCNQELSKDNMMDFTDEGEDEFTQNTDYCTLHGDPVTVLTDDSGEIYVNYKDVKKAGFVLFRRDNFDVLLMDRRQISKEFELFLLAEARTYILKRRLRFSEEEILSTIERCREMVLSDQSNTHPSTNARRVVNGAGPNLTVTNGNVSGFAESRDEFKKPRPPHKNFQLNNSVTNERSDWNEKSFGGDRRGSDRSRDSGGGNNRDRSQLNNVSNDNDFRGNRSNAQESAKSKPSGQDFGRNKQTGGAFRKNTGMEDTSFQNNRNNQDSQNSRGTQPRRQQANSNASVSGDDCSSVRSDKFAKRHEKEKIESVTLQPGNTYDVIVSYVDNEKVQWVQIEEYNEKVIDMTVELVDAAPLLDDIENPIFGQLVLAQHEEVWYRARVINQEPLLVHYLDYGNKNKPSGVKVIPEEYKKMPATALRTTGLQNLKMNILENQSLRLHIKQQYDDGTYLVKLKDAGSTHSRTQEQPIQTRGSTSGTKSQESYNAVATPSTPQQDLEENTPAKSMERQPGSRTEVAEDVYTASNLSPLFKLKNDEPVKIIGRRDCQLLMKNKECYEKSKELNEYIKNLDKSSLTLGSVKVGQLVLAKKDDGVDNEIWQRATVLSKEGAGCIQICYIDFPGEDTLAVKSLRNVDEHLAKYPALMTITQALTALDSGVSPALEYIEQLIQEKAKLILVIEGDDVDFKFEDGSLLSKKIFNLNKGSLVELPKLVPVVEKAAEEQPVQTEKPSPVSSSAKTAKPATQPSPNPKQNEQKAESIEPFTLDYMDWTRLSVGTHDVLFYNINDATDITVASMDEKLLDQLALVSAIQVNDSMPYEPVEGEMCLVAYKSETEEESSWYRAFITSVDGEKYTATCVDFGNEVVVTKNDIRKFPLNLKDIPMMGIVCECVGIQKNDEVTKKLKELLPEGEQAEIKVIECVEDEMKCKIEIPKVYEALKQQGVI